MNNDTDKLLTEIAEELFDIWKEAKESSGDSWGNMLFKDLPEKHQHEYYLTAKRILAKATPLIRAETLREVINWVENERNKIYSKAQSTTFASFSISVNEWENQKKKWLIPKARKDIEL